MNPRLAMLAVAMTVVAADAAAQGLLSGTAFSVAPELLITNQPLVSACRSIEVVSSDSKRMSFVDVADAVTDLAILRVRGLKGTTATLRSPTTVRLGEPVFAFGFPLVGASSSGGNFTLGIVSALRGWHVSTNQIQITSPIRRGNSGGPLMDSSGLMIGVVQSKLDTIRDAKAVSDLPQNVNFAISLAALTQFLVKHKIDFRTAPPSAPLDPVSVAEMAQNFTHRIECSHEQGVRDPLLSEPARTVLYEKDRTDPNGKRYFGTATWRTETVASNSELVIRADINVPQRNLDMVMLLRRNPDPVTPASHTIEFRFNNPAGRVANVPGILMKVSQERRGLQLASLTVKISNSVFLLGLAEADEDRNTLLLRERPWFDIPVVYNDNTRAILAVNKGPDGIRAFEQAFTSWRR